MLKYSLRDDFIRTLKRCLHHQNKFKIMFAILILLVIFQLFFICGENEMEKFSSGIYKESFIANANPQHYT